MSKLNTASDLSSLKNEIVQKRDGVKRLISLCGGTGCTANKSNSIKELLREKLDAAGLNDVQVKATGCHGFCEQGPLMIIQPENWLYTKVTEDDVEEIIETSIKGGSVIERLLYVDPVTQKPVTSEDDITFYSKQNRVLLKNNKDTNPQDIEDYIFHDGYTALAKVLGGISPDDVIATIKDSGLKGRGGAGFPTGIKWELMKKSAGDKKYLICNADEGDPGAYMDRSLLEGNPHAIIEGMLIGAYAMGASDSFVYVREEYPLAIINLQAAIDQAKELGLLGENILGSGFNFDITIYRGAGAFVCGEETALMNSIMGLSGEPRQRPPYPAVSGLWGYPTNINNVETWANIPHIINKGAEWFQGLGTPEAAGTKIFSLVGKINNTGLVEVPMGITLKEVVYDIGGGIPGGKKLKAVQTGGPSGGCIPANKLDIPIDYKHLYEAGSIIGSGGMIVMDEDTCVVDLAKYFIDFTLNESCGKCSSCREGLFRLKEILTSITEGEVDSLDVLDLLEELSEHVKDTSMCGLGQSAPNPVLSTLRYFREEYVEHIIHKKCRAGVCTSLFEAPCQNTCPAGTNVPGYIQLIKEGKYFDAYDLNKEYNPFPAVCGRVCPHPCEDKCKRGLTGDPLAIATLKRAAADYTFEHRSEYNSKLKTLPDTGKKIAIVGGGPAGMSAAFYLRRLGHSPVIYEAKDKLGGMMIQGIPPYRLPRKILEQEVQDILDMGVEAKLNTTVGKDVPFAQLKSDFDAVFVAPGAPKEMKLGIDGEDSLGSSSGLKILTEQGMTGTTDMGKKVVVIGGGNVAIDAARTARRMGAEVTIVYRRTRNDMPAYEEEIHGALEEGIELMTQTNPIEIISEGGHVSGVKCMKQDLGPFDSSGRPRPIPIEGSEFVIEVDTILAAIGQRPDMAYVQEGTDIELRRNGTGVADDWTMGTTTEGVFLGGDAHWGADTVIRAIADGKMAAGSIDQFLMGENRLQQIMGDYKYAMVIPPGGEEPPRVKCKETDPSARNNFDEVVLPLDEEAIKYECDRCLRCDVKEVVE